MSRDPTPVTPWQQIVGVLVLLWLFDFALALRPAASEAQVDLRATLARARAQAEAGHRTIVLLGDAPVLEDMRRELSRRSDARLEQIELDGLLPIDALHLVAELDRLDPRGDVELLIELDLRDFAAEHAEQRECTRAAVCELGPARLDPRTLEQARRGLSGAAAQARERVLAATPVHRRRARLQARTLEQLPGLAVARQQPHDPIKDDEEVRYDSVSLDPEHAQVEALRALLERASARGRKVTAYLPPLADGLVRRSFDADGLGRRYAALARLIHDHADPKLALIDLDHPLFVDAHFIDQVELGPEGSRRLAINLLHELNLPLERRPFEEQIVHPEGHDRTLVHRVDSGYAEGGAWQALFDRPEGVAVSRDGTRILVADTHNHVLRELRGRMQVVETVAGQPGERGRVDGPGRSAMLDHPRSPELLGDALWFIDGERRDRLRVLERGRVSTPELRGPGCDGYQSLRARHDAIWALCSDSRMVRIDVERRETEPVFADPPAKLVGFDLGPDAIYFADADGRLWSRSLDQVGRRPRLGAWTKIFANTAGSLLPHGRKLGYPYAYDELRLAKVVDLRFIDRYGGLLIADEFPQTRRAPSERVQLRYFDLDAERILPWIKAVPHGEAHALYNSTANQIVSYWHLGAMAIAQDDASLVWIERDRSRLLRIADGLLGVAKAGNHHTSRITIPMLQTVSAVSRTVEAQMRPDRFLDARHEPLWRRGPYVALLLGSSLSSMSDRFSNYSLGRRIELELQRELGYRDRVRIDLFQISAAASSFGMNVNNLANWMKTSVPPDVVLIEAHDFGGGSWYMRDSKTRAEVVSQFNQLRRLADRYDTLVVFYDLSSIEANRRDGMRSTDKQTRELLEQARALGFVVLDPGDRLLRELLRHSPWGNQPFAHNQHHGASWAVDLTAETLAAMLYPTLRSFLHERVPARLRERPPGEFDDAPPLDSLRRALDAVDLDPGKLAAINPSYVQSELVDDQLQVYVDLAGFREFGPERLDALAVAVIREVLRQDIYADFAASVRLEMVEFSNYDEYGNGVLDSAKSRWKRELDRKGLEQFLRKHRPR